MSIHRRRSSPYFWVAFEFKGRRYRRSTRTRSRRSAEQFERQLRQDVYDQVVLRRPAHAELRFADAVRRYQDEHLAAKRRADRTTRGDRFAMAKLVRLVGPDTVLHDVTTPVVAALKGDLLRGGSSPATVNRYLAGLGAVLRMAHFEWAALPVLPRFILYPLANQRTRWLRADEEARLLVACEPVPHLHDLVVFLLETGTRLREATGLQWADVDLVP